MRLRSCDWTIVVIALATLTGCGDDAVDTGAGDASSDAGAADATKDTAACAPLPKQTIVDPPESDEVVVEGDPGSALGIFDPSLVYPAGAPGGALSYSSVPAQNDIRTRIALSNDKGASWHFAAEANTPTDVTIDCDGKTCTGRLIDEVSSLLLDPDDPAPARRWKLFTHRYLVMGQSTLRYELGHIALFTAPAPEGPWSGATKLLGWPSSSKLSSEGATTLTTSIPALADCVVLSEPGSLWIPGGGGAPSSVDLALTCIHPIGAGVGIRVELLRSVDHAVSFQHVATLVRADQAGCFGSTSPRISAPGLFSSGGHEYLVVSPEVEGVGYQGCLTLAIENIATGGVARTPVRFLAAPGGRFSGACAYAEGASPSGYLMPQAFLGTSRPFRIFRSKLGAP